MNDKTKNVIELASISKDIRERDEIVSKFTATGILDRDEVIRKIIQLQNTDIDIRIATSAKQISEGFLNLNTATDEQLIYNLNFQLELLKGKQLKKATEDDE